ncbi:MAG: TetR/AcrR family transcriptional regulator [Alphaproteobacteria bacterium]
MQQTAKTPQKRQRAPQKRAEDTQEHLIQAAINLFPAHGYEGVSIRMIETQASVKRGLVAYHFGNKEELWKEAMRYLLTTLADDMATLDAATQGLDRIARLRAATLAFMRYSARLPQLNHVMVQEAKQKSWRSDFMLEGFIRPLVDWMSRLAGQKIDVHTHYMLIGAATFVFNVEYECETLFGVNPREEDFVRDHANAVVEMLLAANPSLLEEEKK